MTGQVSVKETWSKHMKAAQKALVSANNYPTHATERGVFAQIALANVAFARELREGDHEE